MAAYLSLRLKSSFHRLKSLPQRRRSNHTLDEGEFEARFPAKLSPKAIAASGHVDTSKWKKMDSRRLGISLSMIPEASRIVLKVLQNEGYDAYLVGGCVRDLLLSKTPKDFDVITTATLQEIKENFHRAFIVGRRFPICRVHIKGSIIEVSSFETTARDAEAKDVQLSKLPEGYDEKDMRRWRNSLKRDFTINSLFYDPFANKIYDYSSGVTDLTFLKLRTLIPADLSFKEDCARILRGLRLAARLGLSFAEDTEKEIHNLYGSVATLEKARLMMEMSSMLSYGAAEASLVLLKRFNLLEVLLPFQAAYLAHQSGAQNPSMLMELFVNLDMVVSCDRPCNSGLWVSLLTFHLALVNHPQDALVIWTLSSVLYHGNWKEGVKTARELAGQSVNFVPEILESSNDLRDEKLAEKVANFVSTVLDSIDALTDSEGLIKAMGGYQSSPRSLLVFISKNTRRQVGQIFSVLMDDIESLEAERHHYSVDCKLLGKGDIEETRFVLGKVIMETMKGGISYYQPKLALEKERDLDAPKLVVEQLEVERSTSMVSKLETSKSKHRIERGLGKPDELNWQGPTKQPNNAQTCSALEQKLVKEKIGEIRSMQNIAPKNQQPKQEMKDVAEFLSLQKTLTQKYAKLETGKNGEAGEPINRMSVLRKGPKMMNEHKAKLTPMVLNLKTAKSKERLKRGSAKSKDRVKRGSGQPDNDRHQQRPKKQNKNKKTPSDSPQMLVKEKIGEILRTQPKQEMKDVAEFLSLQKTLTQKYAKLETGKNSEAGEPINRMSVLRKGPKMMNEHKAKLTPMVLNLKTAKSKERVKRGSAKSKDRVKRGSGQRDNEQHQQRPKKQNKNKKTPSDSPQMLVKEKIGEILRTQDKTQKSRQQNKVKDMENLLSLRKILTQKYANLKRGKPCEAEGPGDILSVLQRAPKMTKEHKSKPNLMVSELEMPETKDSGEQASCKPDNELCQQKPKKQKQNKKMPSPLEQKLVKEKIGQILGSWKNEQLKNSLKDIEQRLVLQKKMTQKDDKLERGRHVATKAPKGILSVLEKASQIRREDEADGPSDLLNVLRCKSNLFEREKEPIEKGAKPVEEQRVGEEPPKSKLNLSSIFK